MGGRTEKPTVVKGNSAAEYRIRALSQKPGRGDGGLTSQKVRFAGLAQPKAGSEGARRSTRTSPNWLRSSAPTPKRVSGGDLFASRVPYWGRPWGRDLKTTNRDFRSTTSFYLHSRAGPSEFCSGEKVSWGRTGPGRNPGTPGVDKLRHPEAEKRKVTLPAGWWARKFTSRRVVYPIQSGPSRGTPERRKGGGRHPFSDHLDTAAGGSTG